MLFLPFNLLLASKASSGRLSSLVALLLQALVFKRLSQFGFELFEPAFIVGVTIGVGGNLLSTVVILFTDQADDMFQIELVELRGGGAAPWLGGAQQLKCILLLFP